MDEREAMLEAMRNAVVRVYPEPVDDAENRGILTIDTVET